MQRNDNYAYSAYLPRESAVSLATSNATNLAKVWRQESESRASMSLSVSRFVDPPATNGSSVFRSRHCVYVDFRDNSGTEVPCCRSSRHNHSLRVFPRVPELNGNLEGLAAISRYGVHRSNAIKFHRQFPKYAAHRELSAGIFFLLYSTYS